MATSKSPESRKQRLGAHLWRLADLEQANNSRRSFSSRAYREAVWALDHLSSQVEEERAQLLAVPGIGASIADLIEEFRHTGSLARLVRLEERLPHSAPALARLPRMTPARLRWMKQEVGVGSRCDLLSAIEQGTLVSMKGVGEVTLSLWKQRLQEHKERMPIYRARRLADRFLAHVGLHLPHIDLEMVGGVVLLDEWVDQVELLAVHTPELEAFLAGSAVVTRFQESDEKWLLDTLAGKVTVHLTAPAGGLAVVSPPPRSEAAPHPSRLVRDSDLRGDFHLHTDWSPDGRQSLTSLVEGCRLLGWDYVAITDHGRDLRFGGLDEERLSRQAEDIAQLREENPDLLILHGAELNISRAGGLDFDDEVLAALDFRLAAIHSHFGLTQLEQTERLVKAVSHPLVNAIAHPTGRRIGLRLPVDLDVTAVFEAAATHRTALEVNGHLDRLDLSAPNALLAARAGAIFLINSDAHRRGELTNIFHGVTVLQTAEVTRERVVNTWDPSEVISWLEE